MDETGMDETGRLLRNFTLNRRWFNASLLVSRDFDGHIVSMQQSGSHWVKNMLSSVLIQLYGLPPMEHIQDDSVIGHPRTRPKYPQIPQIIHSHGCPHALTWGIPGLKWPKYLVLVRDLRDSLVSHYERFRGDYNGADFATYLKGDVRQKAFYSDIWSRIRFMNEWGRMLRKHPDKVTALRYEDLKADTAGSLRAVCRFFGIENVTDAVVEKALADGSREKMAGKPNPAITTTVVRAEEGRPPLEAFFTPENQAVFDGLVRRHLTHDFGYGYLDKTEKRA